MKPQPARVFVPANRAPLFQRPSASAYRPCACPDCFETAIGEPGAMCDDCETAGCDGKGECESPNAYGGAGEE